MKNYTEKANLIKSITKVEGTPSTTLEYLVVLHNFGSYEGEVSIEVAAETLEDQSDNKNVISPKQGIGNINWVEANDPEGNKYHAFRGDIVDFTKPTITYKYATVEGETNAVVDKEGKKLIVIFDLTEKNIYTPENPLESAKTTLASLKDVFEVYIDGKNEIVEGEKTFTHFLLENPNSKLEEIASTTNGKRYKLTLAGFEQIHNGKYLNYSGPVQLVFDQDFVSDTSGNKLDPTTLTINYDDGEPIIVDVIKPVWENAKSIVIDPSNPDKADKAGTVKIVFRGTDKYLDYDRSSLEIDELLAKINVYKADGTTTIDSVEKTLVVNEILTEDRDGNPFKYGVEYTLTLDNFEDYSGKVFVKIDPGALIDQSDLVCEGKTYEIDYVDFIRPVITPKSATSMHDEDKMVFVFTATDDYMKSTSLDESHITVWIDSEIWIF